MLRLVRIFPQDAVENLSASHGAKRLSGGGDDGPFTFEDVLFIMITLFAFWFAGRVFKKIGFPSLVGDIIMGIIVGPHLTDFAPKPEALMLVGEVGLLLLVLEAGLDVDLKMLKKMGARAVAVALCGSMIPLGIGFGIALAMGLQWKAALVVGVVLSPTSVGIALNVLNSANILCTETGQLIIAAAILDDIIALILLSELEALEQPSAWAFIKPLVVAFALLFGVGAFAIFAVPRILKQVLPKVPEDQRESFVLFLIFTTAIGMIPGVHYAGGSHLLGAFLAGLCYCTDHHVHHAWIRQVKRVMHWLLTIFFACTIGFEIPIKDLFTAKVVKTAAAYFVAILGKVLTGVWASPLSKVNFFTVGFSMSAWGEFAFVVASAAQAQHLIDRDTFSSCVLAVLTSVIFGPTLLKLTLSFRPEAQDDKVARERFLSQEESGTPQVAPLGAETRSAPAFYLLCVACSGRPGQQACLLKAVTLLNLEIIDARVSHTRRKGDGFRAGVGSQQLITDVAVQDAEVDLPMTVGLNPADRRRWHSRRDEIVGRMKEVLEDGTARVELERWRPGWIDGEYVADLSSRNCTQDLTRRSMQLNLETYRRSIEKHMGEVDEEEAGPPVLTKLKSEWSQHGPSLETIYTHADLELRRRWAERDEAMAAALEPKSLKKPVHIARPDVTRSQFLKRKTEFCGSLRLTRPPRRLSDDPSLSGHGPGPRPASTSEAVISEPVGEGGVHEIRVDVGERNGNGVRSNTSTESTVTAPVVVEGGAGPALVTALQGL